MCESEEIFLMKGNYSRLGQDQIRIDLCKKSIRSTQCQVAHIDKMHKQRSYSVIFIKKTKDKKT